MRPARLAAGLAAACLALAPLAGCASVPASGPVMYRAVEDNAEEAIALSPPAPRDDAVPEDLIKSFLLAGSAGATATTRYETAELYLTEEARKDWSPTGSVVVYSGVPEYLVTPKGEDRARVTLSVQAEARVDSHGTYSEASRIAPFTTTFTLVRNEDEQWRVSDLDDGVFVATAQFADQFRATPVYFPSPDEKFWVPDQRWFPRSAWRTSAVAEMLSGPPEWLRSAVGTAAPPGTQLAVPSVTENADGEIEVRLGEEIADLPDPAQALLQAQLAATLTDGGIRPEIALYAGDARLPETAAQRPALPETRGLPIALSGGELFTVSDGELTGFEEPVNLDDLSPTAIARGPEAGPVVVRDGMKRIVQVTDAEVVGGQRELLTGKNLVDPSVDAYGHVWSSTDPGRDVEDENKLGRLLVAHASGPPTTLKPDWLSGRQVLGVRVAPDGTRIAVVSRTEQSTSVHVAAVVRNENHLPVQITTGVEVGAKVPDVTAVQWSGETSLLLFTQDDDATAMHETGMGGLPDASGGTESVQELPGVRTVTAGADSGVLALTNDGDLYEEQATGWGDPIAGAIDAVAYPG